MCGRSRMARRRSTPRTLSHPTWCWSGVMMPKLDGFGLLHALRADPQLREIPIILLSARAGEESRIDGIEMGKSSKRVQTGELPETSASNLQLTIHPSSTLELGRLCPRALKLKLGCHGNRLARVILAFILILLGCSIAGFIHWP
jgi:CheY-like chemotaxis protein